MSGMTVGAGLLALGFWCFVAAVAVAAIWNEVRRREAEHETLRRLIGGGQSTDPALMDRLLSIAGDGRRRPDRMLKAAGLVVLSAAPGLALLGWIVNPVAAHWLVPLLGGWRRLSAVSGSAFWPPRWPWSMSTVATAPPELSRGTRSQPHRSPRNRTGWPPAWRGGHGRSRA